ncbi:hypothetical protein CVT25_014145 [Psilocybe cyanescens]|uniref:Uncharacterized protein n=1 Tax=Psilocybe cyanescens TaxID=93625 RepID=A0A409XG69_PSICY|nr:hypothetical protein CVT25_014145 [Psilocybe cyanescens]
MQMYPNTGFGMFKRHGAEDERSEVTTNQCIFDILASSSFGDRRDQFSGARNHPPAGFPVSFMN